jgi:hypothetical protein
MRSNQHDHGVCVERRGEHAAAAHHCGDENWPQRPAGPGHRSTVTRAWGTASGEGATALPVCPLRSWGNLGGFVECTRQSLGVSVYARTGWSGRREMASRDVAV